MALPNVDISTLGAEIKVAYEGEDDTNALTDALLALIGTAIQANGSVSLSEFLDFDSVAAPAHAEGRMYYDSTEKALSYYNEASDVTINMGQEMVLRVRNTTGSQLDDGTVVYVSGSTGEVPQITKAIATAHATSRVIGVVTHDIANNGFGYATTFGIVRGINTVGYSAGDVIYLSASTAGEFTATPPTSPDEVIEVGIVVKVAASGKIFVQARHMFLHQADIDTIAKLNAIVADETILYAGSPLVIIPIIGAASDETTDLTTGAAKLTFIIPYAGGFTLTGVIASLTGAPTGSIAIFDINEAGASVLSTKISIDVSETDSTTADTPPVISDSALAGYAKMTFDIDQIGSGDAGTGIKFYLIGYPTTGL